MTALQWRKEALLEAIFTEIEEGVVMEENIKRLENLVEILLKQGLKVPESVKKAYCHVALDCTARCLAQKRDAKEAFIETIRSIWLGRIMPLCDEASCLITRELLDSCKRLWNAYIDEKAYESLMNGVDTRGQALVSLRRVVSELHPNPDYSYDVRSMYMAEVESSEQESHSSGESKAESSSPCRIKTVSSAIVDRALGNLSSSKGTSNVNNETVAEQEDDVANLSATNTKAELSLMEQKSTAETCEGNDSIEGSEEEMSDDCERNNTAKRKSTVVSPSERSQSSKTDITTRLPWSTAEMLAVMEGYEKYGSNWKLIKEEYPILKCRTNGDIEDKFLKSRHEEHHP